MSENDTLRFGGFPPPQKTRRHKFRNYVLIPAGILAGVIAVVIIVIAALGGGKAAGSPPSVIPTTFSPSVIPATTTAPAPSDTLTGPVGTLFTVTTQDSSGNDITYDVTAVKVLDPARGSDEFNVPDTGKRFVGVEFKITGGGGYAHDNANSDALIQGSDGQTYTADFSSLSAGTNFNSGDFGVSSGRSQTGWVAFQLPKGVSVASVQWQPDAFGDQQPATWTTG